jgi:hypothetical protein
VRRTLAIISITLLALLGSSLTTAVTAQPRTATAHLSGANEVPANDSRATGQAIFQLSRDGQSISYRLIVANIENVTMAHIHLAPAGANGPVVVWLYPSAPPAQLIPGRSSGVLATGTFTAENLVGPLAGQSLDALLDAFLGGDLYVNVHTSQYPPGEVRGQIR